MKKITIFLLVTFLLLSSGFSQKRAVRPAPIFVMPSQITLEFTGAYLYHNVTTGSTYESMGNMSITPKSKWGVFRWKSYLYHVHHEYMGRHFWKVNTSGQFFLTADGNYLVGGGNNYSPIDKKVRVIVNGDPHSPKSFKLIFKKAYFSINTKTKKVMKTVLYDTNLTTPEEWKVCVGKRTVDIKSKYWPANHFWRINLIDKRVLMVKRGYMCEKIFDSYPLKGIKIFAR